MQGGCKQHFFDGATQNLVQVVSRMMFTPYNLPVERWFFERDGKTRTKILIRRWRRSGRTRYVFVPSFARVAQSKMCR